MATMLKCCCVSTCLKVPKLTTKKMFIRSLRILKKDCWVAMNQSYSKRLWHSRNNTSRILTRFGALCELELPSKSGFNCRYYSKIEDDEMLKTLIKEIKHDFQVKNKVCDDKTTLNADSADGKSDEESSKNEASSTVDVEDFDKAVASLEKHGFTSDEIIELLKSSQGLDDEIFSEMSSDNDSSSDSSSEDSDIESDSGSESDTDKTDDIKSDSVVGSEGENKMEQEDWAVVKMKDSIKSEWSEIEIEDFVNIAEVEPDVEEWIPPVDLTRGNTGVFEVEEVVTVLRHANAQDIFTIHIPPHLGFADYMVIASAKSPRHIKAITGDLHWIYKRRMYRKDKHFKVEGEDSDWQAVDLGNVVLHIFMPKARELYDLETLWTVGSKFDPQCVTQEDPYTFSVDDLPWLRELEEASGNKKQASVKLDQADVKM